MQITENYRKLEVWQKSCKLVPQVYELARMLPSEEKHALSLQMRRAAISIPSNIAEGKARGGKTRPLHLSRNRAHDWGIDC